jgi:Ca2+-binding RTX toxin-like protein
MQTISANAWFRGTSGNDSINGSSSDDTIAGGKGDDYLQGNDGNDIYVYASGDGNDEINDQSPSTTQIDTLKLTDLNEGDITISRTGNNILVGVNSTGQSIKIDNQFYSLTANYGIEKIQFADGSSWNQQNINDAASTFTWTGSASNPTLTGNDYGHNVFQLGAGSETATGGAGNNVYQVSTSTGQADIILPASAASSNELDFLGGITDNQLWFAQSGNNLQIDLMGTSTRVTLDNWFAASNQPLQELAAGGLKLDSQLSQLVQAMATYSANAPGFDPAASGNSNVPANSNLQTAIAAAWHS